MEDSEEDVPAPLVIKKEEPKNLWDDEDEPAQVNGSSGDRYINLVCDIGYMESRLYGIPVYDCYYPSLRAAEAKKRIKYDYMDEVQDYAKIYMRAVTIDWLVKVSDTFDLLSTTLHLAVNYMDRYLCATPVVGIRQFQLIGASCIVIASTYSEVYSLYLEDMCSEFVREHSVVDELVQMESSVLNTLEFDLHVPTASSFLARFARATEDVNNQDVVYVECVASYICTFSLIEYGMLRYAPSLVAASAIYLARYSLFPSQKPPWNLAIRRYTQYQPSDLYECVKALHTLVVESPNSSFPSTREKFSNKKHLYVSTGFCCPPSIPTMEHFENSSST